MKNYISPLDISDYLKRAFKRFFIGLPIVLLLCYLLIGCGAKKVNKHHTEKEVKTETIDIVKKDIAIDTNVKTEIKSFVVDSTKEEIEEVEITPIDNLKPAIFEGKEITNTKLIKRKIKRNKALKSESNTNTQLNEKTTDKTTENKKKQEQTEESSESKDIDKEQYDFMPWWVWCIIASVSILFIFLLYRKFKKVKEVSDEINDII